MSRAFFRFVMLFLTTFAVACGGSTTGTGGVKFSGVVQDESGKAIGDVLVSVNGGPDTALSAADGSFAIYAEESATYEITFATGLTVSTVTIENVPAETKEVSGVYTITSDSEVAVPSDIVYASHTEASSAPAAAGNPQPSATPKPNATPKPTATLSVPSPASAATPIASPTENEQEPTEDATESESPTPSASATPEDESEDEVETPTPAQPTSTPDSHESEGDKRVETGAITALSAASLVVNAVTFTINSETEWKDLDEEDTDSSAFSVGDTVRVKGEYSNGRLVAYEVRKR